MPDTTALIRASLDSAWTEWIKAAPDGKPKTKSQGAMWRHDNPGEWALLQAYRAGTAPQPSLNTNTGKQMVEEVEAWLATAPAVEPPPVDPPPTGAWTLDAPQGPFNPVDRGFQSPYGFVDYAGQKAVIRKQHIQRCTNDGIRLQRYYGETGGPGPPLVNPVADIIEDCIIEHCYRNPPRSGNGTTECCVWLGNKALVQRIVARNPNGWMAAQLCSESFGTIMRWADLEGRVALYVEHDCRDSIIEKSRMVGTDASIFIEWSYKDWGHYPAGIIHGSRNLKMRQLEVYCPRDDGQLRKGGIVADAGSGGHEISSVHFYGPGPAIILPKRLEDGVKPTVVDERSCVFSNEGGHVLYHDRPIGVNGQ